MSLCDNCKHLMIYKNGDYVDDVSCFKNHTEVLSPSRMYCNDFVKDCTAIEEELSNLKCANENLPLDKNGYNKIVCPLCNSDLEESRQVAYPNGEVYYEFDCTECDFSGRIRKGNLYD